MIVCAATNNAGKLRELRHTHFRVLITEMRIVESDLPAFLYKH